MRKFLSATRFSIPAVGLGLLYLLITACKNADPPPSSGLNGLYRAFPAVRQFGASQGEAYIFSAAGDVYQGWPGTQPPENFDFAKARVREPAQTGKYAVSGDKIIFRWSNQQSDTANFSSRRDPKTGKTTLSIGPNYCFKIIPWIKPLNGTFEPSTYQGGFPDPDQQTPDLLDPISFSAQGRFTVTGDDKTVPPVQGGYTINKSGLTLIMPDGSKRAYSLHVFEDRAEPPAAVLINGRPFYAKNK